MKKTVLIIILVILLGTVISVQASSGVSSKGRIGTSVPPAVPQNSDEYAYPPPEQDPTQEPTESTYYPPVDTPEGEKMLDEGMNCRTRPDVSIIQCKSVSTPEPEITPPASIGKYVHQYIQHSDTFGNLINTCHNIGAVFYR